MISLSDAATTGEKGEPIGLIRMRTYEEPVAGYRELHQEKIEATLKERGEKIEKIRKNADGLGAEIRIKNQEQIEELHGRHGRSLRVRSSTSPPGGIP